MGCGGFILAKKLKFLSEKLRNWAKHSFESIKLKKQTLLLELDTLDQVKEVRSLSEVKAKQDFELLLTLENIFK